MSTQTASSECTLSKPTRPRWISSVLAANVTTARMTSASVRPTKVLLKSGSRGVTIRVKSLSGSNTLNRRESRPPLSRARDRLPRRVGFEQAVALQRTDELDQRLLGQGRTEALLRSLPDHVEGSHSVQLAENEVLRLAEAEELGRAGVLRDEGSVRGVLVTRDDDVVAELGPPGDQ